MAKKAPVSDLARHSLLYEPADVTECPFREFRDNELSVDSWGMGTAAFRRSHIMSKTTTKIHADNAWVDDQAQPLPRSVRQYLHGWVRAEELAARRWEAEVVVFEENNDSKMSVTDIQLSHTQVIMRSSFCRRVLSMCYILEKNENFTVEHQWEGFIFNIGPEGWRARYHIYSPGMKAGGGQQHRPVLSKNGCYLVRLYYLGAWRCVWVDDKVPLDATDAPLLPFSPLTGNISNKIPKPIPTVVTAPCVHLWPLLICKALLKLAAPNMNTEDFDDYEDEPMIDFDILHSLTGALPVKYLFHDEEETWRLLYTENTVFSWDDDNDTIGSTIKTKSTKKPTTKETTTVRTSLSRVVIGDTKTCPPYALPGISPAHEMDLLVTMIRDLPLKKPLPEPEVPLWKTYRWVDWARGHGLYEAYDCPRSRFLKVKGLLSLSHAPQLLDIQSNESLTAGFREQHGKSNPVPKKPTKEVKGTNTNTANSIVMQQMKDELREWILYDAIKEYIKYIDILYYPSMYEFTTVSSHPPIRITKAPANKALDISAPKSSPLYLQIDAAEENILQISLNSVHPRVLLNSGIVIADYIEPTYLLLEVFEWFIDHEMPVTKGYIKTRGYKTIEVNFLPGRHFCRMWIHGRMNWHAALLSKSTLLLGSRDIVQSAAVRECPWASIFLLNLGTAFSNWIRVNKSSINMNDVNKEFYRSYQPDLEWDSEIVGYDKALLHWMFKQTVQSLLMKKLVPTDYMAVCPVLRRQFCDPDFGLPLKPIPPKKILRDIIDKDPCDCFMEEEELVDAEENEVQVAEENYLVSSDMMEELLRYPESPETSKICQYASENLPCEVLKLEREKVVRRHEAATKIQANWRGTWARKCLTDSINVTPEILKCVMENAFGNLEALVGLMNEFFDMYPGAKSAYSVASALTGSTTLRQYMGTVSVTPKCKWIPYFHAVFFCHAPVLVHFDVRSSLHSTISVYNNDTEQPLPQAYNTHTTFNIEPNVRGYTVMSHSVLAQPLDAYSDVQWQLTVMCSLPDMFHMCENMLPCRELPLLSASKLHVDEMFVPNRRNILGGIHVMVTKPDFISFRAAATAPELEMVAVLRSTCDDEVEELGRCSGVGELYWPYIQLEPYTTMAPTGTKSSIRSNLAGGLRPKQSSGKLRPTIKTKDSNTPQRMKQYTIEVTAPRGWPLTVNQWIRVDEFRNTLEQNITEVQVKKPTKEKGVSLKEKDKNVPSSNYLPQPGDAYVELECSMSAGGGCSARRDDDRDQLFLTERKCWEEMDPGRSTRCMEIREKFREKYLELPTPEPESVHEEAPVDEYLAGENIIETPSQQQGPTPVSVSGDVLTESEEECLYLTMPDELKDKFIPLEFVPFCTDEVTDEKIIVLTSEMFETAAKERRAQKKRALARMEELQEYNMEHIIGRQKIRCRKMEKYFTDSQWSPELTEALMERDDAIATETLKRTLSATKKKQELTKKK